MVNLHSETDFVAKNDAFKKLVANLARQVAEQAPVSIQDLLDRSYIGNTSVTVAQEIEHSIATLGENIVLEGLTRLESAEGRVEVYAHPPSEKIGVMVEVRSSDPSAYDKPAFATLLREITMQIAAMNPRYVHRDEIPADELARERQHAEEVVKKMNKPPELAARIIEQRLETEFFSRVCLMDQKYARRGNITIAQLLSETAAKLRQKGKPPAQLEIVRFERMEISAS